MSATSEVSDSAPTQWANSPFPLSPLILIIYSFPSSPLTQVTTLPTLSVPQQLHVATREEAPLIRGADRQWAL